MRLIAVTLVFCLMMSSVAHALEVSGGFGTRQGDAKITARASVDGNDRVRHGNNGGGSDGPKYSGHMCTGLVDPFSDNKETFTVPCEELNGRLAFMVTFPSSAGSTAPPSRDQVEASARDYLKTLAMPVPQPKMSAPEGICGVRHWIELGDMVSSKTFPTETTSFGPLHATAHGSFTVDWGDGTKTTHSSPKGISHYWTTRGTYDITVTARWSLDWSLGGFTGVITGLQTQGSIDDWQVFEAQAVLIR